LASAASFANTLSTNHKLHWPPPYAKYEGEDSAAAPCELTEGSSILLSRTIATRISLDESLPALSENYLPRLVRIVLSLLVLFADLGATSEGQEELPQSFESGTWYLPENGMIILLRQRNLLDKVICQF